MELTVTMRITESEARALDAMAGYGENAFVNAFYENLGKAYMERHENGLRVFLRSVRGFIGPVLHRCDKARAAFSESQKPADPASDANQEPKE